jgi:hypothetical protein
MHSPFLSLFHTHAHSPILTSRFVQERHVVFFAFGRRPMHRRAAQQAFVVN